MLTEDQIQFLNRVCRNKNRYKWIEENGIISFNGNVNMKYMNLTQIPVQFYQINGDFDCSHNKLTTLKGAPSIINGCFSCFSNQLTSLDGGPKYVDGSYSCADNILTNLLNATEVCNDVFYCKNNRLTSLEGCPKIINNYIHCDNNPNLKYLWGICRVKYAIYDTYNEINQWIIKCAKRDVIFPHFTLEENINWIKREQKYSCLLDAPKEIRELFSPRILHLADSGVYNESKILDYKNFLNIC